MKNIPVFLSTGGTASLILKEIPHRGIAYVLLRTVRDLSVLLEECAGFCRSCGAERVFVSRETEPLPLLHAMDMLLLHGDKTKFPTVTSEVRLEAIGPENDAIFQRIYNICFQNVSNAATYESADIRRIYREAQLAFIALTEEGIPFGMGELHGNELAAIGILPEYRGQGRSRDLTLALLNHCPGPQVELTAASDNEAALALYDSLGFIVAKKLSAWYVL